MKLLMVLLAIGVLPTAALAGGEHAQGHSMENMEHHGDEDQVGRKGDPAKVERTVEVTMSDSMRFSPDKLRFKKDETVRLVVHNAGKIRHELVIGTMDELKEHAAMMRKNPAMKHAEPNMISLAPGKTGTLIWDFDRAGTFDFACLVPGHLEAGMRGEIMVK